MKIIDADKLKAVLTNIENHVFEAGDVVIAGALTMVMDAIDMQPMVNLWIPVEKRLPEDDLPADSDRRSIKVLVCSAKDSKNSIKTMTRLRNKLPDGRMTEWSWGRWRKNITHWMPLMELPQEE